MVHVKGIHRRSNGYFYFSKKIKKRQFIRSLGTNDPNIALVRAIEAEKEIEAKFSTGTVGRTIDDFLRYSKNQIHLRKKTWTNYRWALSKFRDEVGTSTRLNNFTAQDLSQVLMSWQLSGYSSTTMHTTCRILKMYFKWCQEQGHIYKSPADHIKLNGAGSKLNRQPVCTAQQRKQLIDNCTNPNLLFVLYAGFHAGLRKLEIVEARTDWFDLERGFMVVRKAEGSRLRFNETPFRIKDSDERAVPLTAEFTDFLRVFLKGLSPLDYCVRSDRTVHVSPYRWDFQQPFTNYMVSQNLSWVTPHAMRRTFASILVQAGVSMTKVAAWLGDALDVTQRHYAFLLETDDDINKGIL